MNLSTRSLCLHKPNNYPFQQARANMPMSSETCSQNTWRSLFLSETLDFSCVSCLCLYSVKWGAMEQQKSEAGEAFCCIRLENILKYLGSPCNLSLYEFKTAIRAWANHIQWKKTYYHDDFCYTSLFTPPFFLVWLWRQFWGFLVFFGFFVWFVVVLF